MLKTPMAQSMTLLVLAAGLGALALAASPTQAAPETAKNAPAPLVDDHESGSRATAIFAGGCFWGAEGVFSHVKGVISAESGYAGGAATLNVSYDTVGTGSTGYAESVRVVYDPSKVSYGTLLRVFFSVIADPTTLNYQGPDHGTQYRSALFPQNAVQEKVARAYLEQLGKSRLWSDPIVTRIEQVGRFQSAEDYHQDFLERNPDHGYIRYWDMPKLVALKRLYPELYTASAAR
jgi:peptide-methionine (S)-S-oxide reductase